jgi:hypothetical protein
MTAIIIVVAVLSFTAIIYGIYKDFTVKTVMKVLGISFSFEAQKQDKPL